MPRPVSFWAVAPLTGEQAAAAEQADLARWRIEDRLRELHSQTAPRGPRCWSGPTLHIRRDRPDGAAIEDALIRTACGRSDCPHCWRRRITTTYRRATRCLLDESLESRLPRVGPVHVSETAWQQWEAFDKALRRQHGGDCGRLRVRRCDNTVLVVSAEPFRGSRSVTPAEALDIVSAAIDVMHTAKHSFRLLGDWSDTQASEWRQVAVYTPQVSLADVQAALAEMAVRTRAFRSPDLQGLLWRCDSKAAAMHLEVVLATMLCPTLAQGDCSVERPKSDTPPDEGEIDDWTPFDDDPDIGSQWT
ncbi:MAG TPA: hypothetical protein VMG10_12075 [Gemmataceae bacterium]|nr:hypothetical protein [Gemmataceae bacterium]